MKTNSDYWMGASGASFDDSDTPDITKKLIRLNSARNVIRNFTTILLNRSVPVLFYGRGGESFTDGRKIYISAEILKKSDLDVAIGVALHESAHILLSDFDAFTLLWQNVPRRIYTAAEKVGWTNKKEILEFCKKMINYVEDRYIDKYIYNSAVGYQSYYDAMYDKYWHSDEISETLISELYREETLEAYTFRVINLTNVHTDLHALSALKAICDVIELDTIDRLTLFSDRLELGLTIAQMVIESIISSPDSKKEKPTWMRIQEEFLAGNVKKVELSAEESLILTMINESQMSIETCSEFKPTNQSVVEKIDCILVRNLTDTLLLSPQFPLHGASNSPTAVDEGIRLGNILGRKLKIIGDKEAVKSFRKSRGNLDRRLIHELGMDNFDIFYIEKEIRSTKVFLHISIDASGSMVGAKWHKTLVSTVAICKAATVLGNIHVVVSFRTTTTTSIPYIVIAYDSHINPFSKVKSQFSKLSPNGATPEGLCFEIIKKELQQIETASNGYFLNISDGEPSYHGPRGSNINYSSQAAAIHTKAQVDKIKFSGYGILSYFISEGSVNQVKKSYETFLLMYGKHASYINITDMNSVSKTMNALFLKNNQKTIDSSEE